MNKWKIVKKLVFYTRSKVIRILVWNKKISGLEIISLLANVIIERIVLIIYIELTASMEVKALRIMLIRSILTELIYIRLKRVTLSVEILN